MLSDVVVAAREIPRRSRLVWGAWLGGLLELRLIISAAAALLAAVLAVMLAHIGYATVLIGRRLAARSGVGQVVGAGLELTNSLLRLAQIAAILFVMSVGTSFFFPGTGSFGGGGIDVQWQAANGPAAP